MEPQEETNNVSNKQLYCRDLSGVAEGKTSAVELMTSYKVNGYGNDKCKKKQVDNQCGRTGIDAEN